MARMIWEAFRRFRRPETPAERFRRVHEQWLTRALQAPADRYPRIPLRRVDAGGFSGLLARSHGADRAARWWSLALERVQEEAHG